MSESTGGPQLPQLDARLQCLADLVPPCDIAADIGADHGRLACYLLARNVCRRMIVNDISEDSLSKSRRLLELHGLSARASLIRADGLDALTEPVSAVVIAGMGGRTIAEIIQKHEKIGSARLIVSAHTEMHMLRERLYEYGFFFEKEVVVRAGGRYYTVLAAKRGPAQYTPSELYLGARLTGSCVLEYLEWKRRGAAVRRDNHRDTYVQWLTEAIESEKSKQQVDL